MFEEELKDPSAAYQEGLRASNIRVKIIGVGGAGTNTVDRIRMDRMEGVELAVVNSDAQALSGSPVSEKVQIGRKVTFGLGCAGDPETGQKAAQADKDHLARMVEGVDLLFLVTGLGGGTGSGAVSLIAEMGRKAGALVISFATTPFTFEGEKRRKIAEDALVKLNEHSDSVISLPNDVLFQKGGESTSVLDAFGQADEWIKRGINAICGMLFHTGLINVDFATLRKAFPGPGGKTLFAVGSGEGPNCVDQALDNLVMCPLLALPRKSAQADSLLVNIIGGADMEMSQVQQIMQQVTTRFGSRDQTVFGAVIDERKHRSIELCVLGMTDLGNERYRGESKKNEAVEPILPIIDLEPEKPTRRRPSPRGGEKTEQAEFDILVQGENRGFFRETEAWRFKGEDLDVPTYLRRGIRIPT